MFDPSLGQMVGHLAIAVGTSAKVCLNLFKGLKAFGGDPSWGRSVGVGGEDRIIRVQSLAIRGRGRTIVLIRVSIRIC
jgi:hypothetical protein